MEEQIKAVLWECPTQDFDKLKGLKEQAEAVKLLKGYLRAFVLKGDEAITVEKLRKAGAFDEM